MKITFKYTLAFCALAALVACGGGGGSSTPSTVTIGGTAAKGLITNAKVLVYATDSSGKQIATPIAEGTTDDNGQYSLAIPPQSTPVIISIVKGTGSRPTKIIDELTGNPESMPDGFELKAVAPSVSANATIGVNPFTDVAASAIPTTGITKDMVETANHWVKTNLTNGVDPISVQPVLTSSAANGAEAQQKTLTAALALVAAAAKYNDRCTAGGVAEKFKCQIEDMRDTVKFTSNSGTPTLSSVNGRITTLMTDSTVTNEVKTATALSSIVSRTDIDTMVSTDSKLVAVKSSTGGSKIDSTNTNLAALAPPTVTEIAAAQEATTYATNLKKAIKAAQSDFLTQKNFFDTTYLNKTMPTLSTVDAGLSLITKYCDVDNKTITVTCAAPSNQVTFSGKNSGTVTLSGTVNDYKWSGTAGNSTIAGTMKFSGSCSSAGVCTMRALINGQFPNEILNADPLDVALDVSLALDDASANWGTDNRNFSMTVNTAQVKFPPTANFPAVVANLTDGKVLGKIYQYGAYRTWNCWSDATNCFVAKTLASDTTSMPTRIQGTLSMTSTYTSNGTTYSDVMSVELGADIYAPTQAVWNNLNARSRYYLEQNKILDAINLKGSLKVGKYNATYSISASMDPDWTGVDLTKPLSDTNYPKGSASVTLDGGNVGGTSLAKMVFTMSRIDFNNAQPTLKLSAGGDTFTFQPNTTNGYVSLNDPGLANMWGSPASYPTTDWFRLDVANSSNLAASGVKAFNSTNAYTIQVSKVSNQITGVVKKGTTTVGEVKDGRLYLDGQIFPLTLD